MRTCVYTGWVQVYKGVTQTAELPLNDIPVAIVAFHSEQVWYTGARVQIHSTCV
jgi:hypothetical protein